ncbi:SIR2 family protein [Shouchella clausii]|uniref:SIR2 family protein n=1 Tax=Shouchella rhizosphaerae TaxID=866786 RepID=A0ABZ2CZM6_9BACI|nr:SIR2 family protein [Shouchella rhizosphaerae]MCM3311429.1 SIR2 family protein [Psychrobacillus sp. MER TA 17]MCM3381049.1 SIR2 family protein [Shouchella rhizosphaerae]
MTQYVEKICECVICKNNHGFSLPSDIIEAVKNRNLVVFAGAGVSTESRSVYNYTLYEEIRDLLNIDESINLSFSELMSQFCKQPNGRAKLLRKIKDRLDYVSSFPELERRASNFHNELSTIHQITEIITTNWDDLFERKCGALPIITIEDFAFWNNPGRKVLKIHGSISNYGTVIATKEDYDKCYQSLNSGIIGSSLKTMLATKCVVFIGYSFGDEDFNKIYNSLTEEMKDFLPHAYIVTLDEKAEEKFRDINITPIITDATFFIQVLKEHLITLELIVPDENFGNIYNVLDVVQEEHIRLSNSFNIKENPEIILTLCYQDGLIHSFERILAMKKSGYYSNPKQVRKIIHNYEVIKQQKYTDGVYHDVAYIDGYINGLIYFLYNEEFDWPPCYYVFGYEEDIFDFKEFLDLTVNSRTIHPESYKYAMNIADKTHNKNGDTVFHHTPFL